MAGGGRPRNRAARCPASATAGRCRRRREVKLSSRRLYLRRVDDAGRGPDAELLEVVDVGQHDALEVRLDEQELGVELLAAFVSTPSLGFQPTASNSFMASARFLRCSISPPATGFVYSVVNTSGGTPSLTSFKISSSRPCMASRLHLRIAEVAVDPDVLAIEQVLVGALEVEREIECARARAGPGTACAAYSSRTPASAPRSSAAAPPCG